MKYNWNILTAPPPNIVYGDTVMATGPLPKGATFNWKTFNIQIKEYKLKKNCENVHHNSKNKKQLTLIKFW